MSIRTRGIPKFSLASCLATALAAAAAVAPPTWATQYRVDPGHLQAALDRAHPGDRILLEAGTYSAGITVRRGGRPGAPVTITRATRKTPVLTGSWTIRAPYVTVRRVIFDGSSHGDYPIWATRDGSSLGDHFTLANSEVRNARLSGIFVGDTSPAMPLRHVVIRRCYFHDNGSSTGYDHGIYIKSGSNHRIEHNLIVRSSGYGIQNYPHAQGAVIRRNEIANNGDGGILIEHDPGDELPVVNETVVDANYLRSNRNFGIKVAYGGGVPPGINNLITDNWASGNGGGQYGSNEGRLGGSGRAHGATWRRNRHGRPRGGVLVRRSTVGPNARGGRRHSPRR